MPLAHLAAGHALVRLAAAVPERVAGWDAILVTAASPQQAALYRLQLTRARARGLLAATCLDLVVPDPAGKRIGSGGATLGALRALQAAVPGDWTAKRVLLIHAGGDSRRLPWANVIGKLFVPFPLLAPAEVPLTLFDHLLAIAAHAAQAMPAGGLLTLTGDVLPLFAAERMRPPVDGGLVVTAPTPLDLASRHGVIHAGADGLVQDLLQKATPAQLQTSGALVGGAALLDTGVYAFFGGAFSGLLRLAARAADPVAELVASGKEMSLYEEMAAGLVPRRHAWLEGRPLGAELRGALQGFPLVEHRDAEFRFVHLGTTAEALEHLQDDWEGRMSRRVLCECGPAVDDGAVIAASLLDSGAAVGAGSLVYGSHLGGRVAVGARAVVLGVDVPDAPLRVPDHACLWQVPLAGGDQVVSVCCGVDDNPKDLFPESSFLGEPMPAWLDRHGITADEIWPAGTAKTLWDAQLFPVMPRPADAGLMSWLLAAAPAAGPLAWRACERLSLAQIHRRLDPDAVVARHEELTGRLAVRGALNVLEHALDRDVSAMAAQLTLPHLRHALGALADAGGSGEGVPASRRLQVRADLLAAGGQQARAEATSDEAMRAVQAAVTAAIADRPVAPVSGVDPGSRATRELPVRFDLAGGWTDTPPYCLERPARVVNLAMSLGGQLPVGAEVQALAEPRFELLIEGGPSRTISDAQELANITLADTHVLLVTALAVCGYGDGQGITQGCRVRTWSHVPRGSGLGGSSILAAALVAALQRLAGRPDDPRTVSDLVLVLEQRMTTGGGWQDQVGALWPGIKAISSVPSRPLTVRVEPITVPAAARLALEQRLVLVFTGQERLAKNVLQMVVRGYLRRDGRVLAALRNLAGLAGDAQQALSLGNLDSLGGILKEVWHAHQQLDPHCSNPAVDAMFRAVEDLAVGGKLAGAGGGGFLGVLAKDAESAQRIAGLLPQRFPGVRVYPWAVA